MKLTDKAKKRLALAGLGIVSIALVVAIASQFKTEEPKGAEVRSSATVSDTVIPSISTPATTGTSDSTPDISIPAVSPTESVSQSEDTGDSNGTEQSIQAEVTKPAEPSEEAKTNSSQTPDGEKATQSENGTSADEPSSSSSTPKSGDKQDGKIYVPGFGWVEDNGGGVQQNDVGSDGDINTQVGNMD